MDFISNLPPAKQGGLSPIKRNAQKFDSERLHTTETVDSKETTGVDFELLHRLNNRQYEMRANQDMGKVAARNGQSPYSKVVIKKKAEEKDCCHRLIKFYADTKRSNHRQEDEKERTAKQPIMKKQLNESSQKSLEGAGQSSLTTIRKPSLLSSKAETMNNSVHASHTQSQEMPLERTTIVDKFASIHTDDKNQGGLVKREPLPKNIMLKPKKRFEIQEMEEQEAAYQSQNTIQPRASLLPSSLDAEGMQISKGIGLAAILGQNGIQAGVSMFEKLKVKKPLTKTEEFKRFLRKYDISKSDISKQLDYIGSTYKSEYYQDRDVRDRGVGSVKFETTTGRDSQLIGSMQAFDASDRRFEPFNQMPNISSKYRRIDLANVKMRKHLGRSVKNVTKEMYEPKFNDLDYTNNQFEYLNKRLNKGITNMSKQIPRKTNLPGVAGPPADDEGIQLIDHDKSLQSYFSNKQKRSYDHLPFENRLGRSQLDISGKRTDLGMISDAFKIEDAASLKEGSIERVSHEEYLPNRILNQEKRFQKSVSQLRMVNSKKSFHTSNFDKSYNSQAQLPVKDKSMSRSAYQSTSLLQDQRTPLDNQWGKGSNLLTGGFSKGTAPYQSFSQKKRVSKSVLGHSSMRQDKA